MLSSRQLLEHRAEFLGFLTRRVGDPAAAEDILQAAYTKALEKGEQIQNTESVVAWFYRMLRNALVDHYRRNAARTRAHDQFVAEAPLSYETEDEANLCACVGGVVKTLKPEYRDRPGAYRSWRRVYCRLRPGRGHNAEQRFCPVASGSPRGGEGAHPGLRCVRRSQMPGLHL